MSPGDLVAITGGCGFIGSHLVRRFLECGFRVNVLDDLSTGRLDNLPGHADLRVDVGNILDPQAVSSITRGASLVIHLASVVGMKLAAGDPGYAYRVSREGTQSVVDQSGDIPIVLFSSSSVYGLGSVDVPMGESQSVSRDDALAYDGGVEGYAAGKWELERIGRETAMSGRKVMTVRPFNIVGKRQSDLYGMVLPTFVSRSLQGKRLVVHDDGMQARSFGDVETFIDCLFRLLGSDKVWNSERNVVNVGKPEMTTIRELARLVMKHTGCTRDMDFVSYGSVFPGKKDVRSRIPVSGRLESLIGRVEWKSIDAIVRGAVAEELERVICENGLFAPEISRYLQAKVRGVSSLGGIIPESDTTEIRKKVCFNDVNVPVLETQ